MLLKNRYLLLRHMKELAKLPINYNEILHGHRSNRMNMLTSTKLTKATFHYKTYLYTLTKQQTMGTKVMETLNLR